MLSLSVNRLDPSFNKELNDAPCKLQLDLTDLHLALKETYKSMYGLTAVLANNFRETKNSFFRLSKELLVKSVKIFFKTSAKMIKFKEDIIKKKELFHLKSLLLSSNLASIKLFIISIIKKKKKL